MSGHFGLILRFLLERFRWSSVARVPFESVEQRERAIVGSRLVRVVAIHGEQEATRWMRRGKNKMPSEPRVNILGVGISVLTMESALQKIEALLDRGEHDYICVTGAQGIIEAQADESFRSILNSSFLTTPDGVPMVWLGHFHGFHQMGRVYGPHLMLGLCKNSVAKGYRHFLYGGKPGVAEELRSELIRRFPGLNIVGTYTPPFRPLNREEEAELLFQIRASQPHVLWCGLGAPKQERFIAAYRERLPVQLMIGVGAAFDLLSGNTREAPEWMMRSGLTSIFRICQEPRRLWRRYLFNNPRFIWLTFLQLTGLRRFDLS
jgi:N-acetylglucosaminyldiphosphoundecaprenol N-acetyl-beta-D-mannosaminyltransferase